MKTIKNWIICVLLFAIATCLAIGAATLKNVKSIIEDGLGELTAAVCNTAECNEAFFRDSIVHFANETGLLTNAVQMLEKQINVQQAYSKKAVTAEMLKTVLAEMDGLRIQLAQQTEEQVLISKQYQANLNNVEEVLAEISNQIAQIDCQDSPTQMNTYITNYYQSTNTDLADADGEADSDGEAEADAGGKEEDVEGPSHTHEFDVYGNCTDETCTVHEDVEVFDIIDLKRATANADYYYRLEWEGDLNFEIIYAFTSPDDVEIVLFSDEACLDAIPMDRVEATYTATMLEAGMYYIQVHTLTDGDIEISIY